MIMVNPLPDVTLEAYEPLCAGNPVFDLYGGLPEGGTYFVDGNEATTFDPAVAGEYVIEYFFTDENGCTNSAEGMIVVNPLTDVSLEAYEPLCAGDPVFDLYGGLPEGGTYFVDGNEVTTFDPAVAGEYVIEYFFTDENGCTNSAEGMIVVNPLPDVTLESYEPLCAGDPEFDLYGGLPEGGTYFVDGNEATTFDPAVAGEYVIEYFFTDENGCTNSAEGMIVVNPLPEVTLEAYEPLCAGDPVFDLYGGLPEGGTYFVDGNEETTFNPAVAGEYIIEYVFTDENGCTNSAEGTIVVNPLTDVICPADFAVCLDTEPFTLTGAEPENGVYSGTGVEDGMFYPDVSGLGTFELTYTFTDNNGCVNFCTYNITVNPVANSYAGNDDEIVAGDYFELSQATASNYSSLLWTGGDGTFDDETALNPIYIPGIVDIETGSVELCLTAIAEEGCYDVTDCMTLTINLLPRIIVSPTSLKRLLEQNQAVVAPLTIENPGYADLTFDITIEYIDGSGWLSIGPNSGTILSLSSEDVDVTFDATGLADGEYKANIQITSNAPETPLVNVPVTLYVGEDVGQLVQLRAGWSGISSYMIPDNPQLEDLFAEQVANNTLEIMLDTAGIFWPGENVNQIGNWITYNGYKVKMNEDDAVIFAGQFVDDKSVVLSEGVSYMPVLSKVPVPASEIFNQVDDKLVYAFDIYNGLVYWPDGGLYTLETLMPGVGYLTFMEEAGSVTFPESDGWNNLVKPMPQLVNNAPWIVDNTGNTHIVSIYSSAFKGLNIGDIVAVFNDEEKCVGMVQFNGGNNNLSLVVYGDDYLTESLDGMQENGIMNFVIYTPSTQEYTETQVNWDISMPNQGTFADYGLSAITSFKLGNVGVDLISESRINIYPNPAIEKVMMTVTGEISGDAQIQVFDTRGSQLINLPVTDETTTISISHLEEGMYIVRITNKGTVFTEKLIIQK